MLIKLTTEMTNSERMTVENSNNQFLQALAYVAVGTIYPYAGTKAPDTFMICDGSALDKTKYAELFSVIGYTFGGSGDTFNLPDLRGKTLVGLNSSDSDFNTLGKKGGEKTHVLTTNEMPSHRHQQVVDNSYVIDAGYTNQLYAMSNKTNTSSGPSTQFTMFTGGGKAHNNMPPYMVCNYIIKVMQAIPDITIRLPINETYIATSENAVSNKAIDEHLAENYYDKTATDAFIKTNSDAISVLNGTGEGSVNKTVNDAINEWAAEISDDGTVNTYKELIDYAATHGAEFTELVGEVTENTNSIEILNGDDTVAGSVAKQIKDAIGDIESLLAAI